MERELKKIKLSNCEVSIVTYLSWGEYQQIESALIGKVNVSSNGQDVNIGEDTILNQKYALLEICVKEIRIGSDKGPFTREWMDNLTLVDGNKLYDEVEELTKKK